MKILIAVPTFENIQPEVFKAIYDLDSAGHDLHFDFVKGYDCAWARNRIGRLAQEEGFDYVLMIDSDTVVPSDTLTLMLDTDVDICLKMDEIMHITTAIFIQNYQTKKPESGAEVSPAPLCGLMYLRRSIIHISSMLPMLTEIRCRKTSIFVKMLRSWGLIYGWIRA